MIKEKFFGRNNYLAILDKRVNALKDGYRQNIAIIGDENVGKTSIIFNYLSKFSDNRIVILYLELRSETLDSFCKRFLGVLFYNFLIPGNIPLREDLDYLLEKSKSYCPKTVEKANSIVIALSKRKKNNIFSELLGLTETLFQETGKRAIVVFDEFHNLENMGVSNIYREWSKLLILQKNTLYIIISSMIYKTKLILSKQLSLLFGNFEVVNIEPFDNQSSAKFLEQRIFSLNLNNGLIEFIINFTGGYPFYLELICDSLLKSPQTQLSDILEEMLFNTSGILNQRFSNYIKRFTDCSKAIDYISILYLISSGRNRIKDIAHILRKQKKELDSRIAHLLELDVLTKSGDFLKITDRLFAYWLRFVYQEKMQSLTFDAKNQKDKFRYNIDVMINEFLAQSRKPLGNRVHELLHLFSNDLMQMERKKIRLNHFQEIKPLVFSNLALSEGLLGRCSDALWIMAIKNDTLSEQFVAEFAKECKRYHHKSQRRIIISLKEIDANARLRALEEKVWAWDLNNLNQILDLFSLSRVIA